MANLKKIIDLLKTDEKLLILDENGDPAGVIMGIKIYDRMVESGNLSVNLTEQQILDKINRDIEVWRENQAIASSEEENANIIQKITQNLSRSSFGQEYFMPKISQNYPDSIDMNSENLAEKNDDHYYFEPVE